MRNTEKQMELGTVINYREGRGGGGLQNGKTAGPKYFAAPSRYSDRVKLSVSPTSVWLKLQAPVLKLPLNFRVYSHPSSEGWTLFAQGYFPYCQWFCLQ